MAEATHQQITTSLPGEEPFIGDLDDGQLCVNTTDGRIWSGDPVGTPVELGGAVKNHPIGPLLYSNYLDIDVTSADSLPIPNTNPLDIPAGFYRETRLLLRFAGTFIETFQSYFDYPVNWGFENTWKFGANKTTPGVFDHDADNPIDFYKATGRKLLVELSAFGPSAEWTGRVLWVNHIPLT